MGSREFVDNDELEVPDLLAAMADEKSASSTACPSPAAFARAFEAGDQTVCFTISANLSGTYNAAVMGREMVLEEHPEKKICIIDSKATGRCHGSFDSQGKGTDGDRHHRGLKGFVPSCGFIRRRIADLLYPGEF